jgi:hypothetical protein
VGRGFNHDITRVASRRVPSSRWLHFKPPGRPSRASPNPVPGSIGNKPPRVPLSVCLCFRSEPVEHPSILIRSSPVHQHLGQRLTHNSVHAEMNHLWVPLVLSQPKGTLCRFCKGCAAFLQPVARNIAPHLSVIPMSAIQS